jgi:hypothetical protein
MATGTITSDTSGDLAISAGFNCVNLTASGNTLNFGTPSSTVSIAGKFLIGSPIVGTVTANGATPVVVSNTSVTANSSIILTYKSGTQSGSGSAWVSSVTVASGFSITSIAGDTAVYNYLILG